MGRIGDSIVGIAKEKTYGTAEAPAARYEIVSEDLKLDIERVESKALGKRYLSTWAPGRRSVEGSIEMEVPSASFGRWLRAATGAAPTTTANNPVNGMYKHEFSGEKNVGLLSGTVSTTVNGATTSSTSVTVTSGTGIAVGQIVTGTGISGTPTVTAVSGTSVTLSAAQTLANGAALTFGFNESLTIEVQRTDVAGDDHRFVYSGIQVSEFEISASAGELAMAKFSLVGQDMSVTQASAQTASYATSTPLVFTGATVTVGGTSRSVKAMSFKTNYGLDVERYFLGSDKRSIGVESQTREAEGSLTIEWNGLTDWNRYVGTDSVAIVATFETQAALVGTTKGKVEVSIPYARIDGEQPVTNDGVIETDVTFKCLDEGASDPFKITLIDTTSAY